MATHPNYITASPSGTVRLLSPDDLAALPHTAVEQACKAAVFQTIAKAKADARQMVVDEVRASVLRLPFPQQMAIVRSIAMAHSEYAGSDDLVSGAESMAEDFRVDILGHDGPAYFESERQVWS